MHCFQEPNFHVAFKDVMTEAECDDVDPSACIQFAITKSTICSRVWHSGSMFSGLCAAKLNHGTLVRARKLIAPSSSHWMVKAAIRSRLPQEECIISGQCPRKIESMDIWYEIADGTYCLEAITTLVDSEIPWKNSKCTGSLVNSGFTLE